MGIILIFQEVKFKMDETKNYKTTCRKRFDETICIVKDGKKHKGSVEISGSFVTINGDLHIEDLTS